VQELSVQDENKTPFMKILFGIPAKVHNEIAQFEVDAFRDLGVDMETSYYGNSRNVSGILKSIKLIIKNAITLQRKAAKQKSDIVYLNTAFDHKTMVRDSITLFILKIFNRRVKIVLKIHGSDPDLVISKKNLLKKYV